jgi:CMP-N,N'-diacetyllegionaminic acid synthase
MEDILAIIPARGGSKGIKNKNLLKLNKKSLIEIAIKEVKKSKFITKILFSSDSNKIIKEAKKFIDIKFTRPKKYSTDRASSYDVARHALNWFEKNNKKNIVKIVVILSPTTPFRTVNDIDGAIKKLIENKKATSVIGITETDYPPYWMLKKDKKFKLTWLIKEKKKYNSRQQYPKIYQPNGMVYALKADFLKKMKGILPQKGTLGYFIDEKRSVNIDNLNQYDYCKYLIKSKIR